MAGGAYRDHLEALLSRVSERHARVLDLESRLELSALARIDRAEHARLVAIARAALSRDFRPHGPLGQPDRAELEQLEAELVTYECELEALAARAPDLELLARTPFGEPPHPEVERFRGYGATGGSFYGALLDEVFDLEESLRKGLGFVRNLECHWEERPEPSIFSKRAVLRARFFSGETPVALAVEVIPMSNLAVYRMTFATTVAQGLPPLCVVPRTALLARGYWFLSRKSHEFGAEVPAGDEAFDATFAVRCPSPSIALGGFVRVPMLELSKFDVPTLRSASGHATLRYEYDPEAEPLRAALAVLSGLRSADVSLSILKR